MISALALFVGEDGERTHEPCVPWMEAAMVQFFSSIGQTDSVPVNTFLSNSLGQCRRLRTRGAACRMSGSVSP